MDDNRPSNHIVYRKTAGQKRGERESAILKKRRQIACMAGMFAAAWVVMGHGARKRIIHIPSTIGSLMNMKSKNTPVAWKPGVGQAVDPGPDDHAFSGLIEPYYA